MFVKYALILAMVAGTHALPVSLGGLETTECAATCPSDSKFAWEPSKTYSYSYTGDIKTHIQGATEEHSSLHLQATAQIEVLSRCELVLKLGNVKLEDSDPTDYTRREAVPKNNEFKAALELNILRFNFLDGEIEGVCPMPGEEDWVLNVKKAVLSHLQNTMPDLSRTSRRTEVDISGECPVLYTPTGSGKIQKSKEIMGCTGSHSYQGVFQGVPYSSASKIQSVPLMKSSHVCEQTINSAGIISEVTCMESHMFRPFSNEESGAVTEVATKLELTRVTNGVRTRIQPIERHEHLYYSDTPSLEEMSVRVRDAQTTISDICGAMQDDVRPGVSGLYTKLVKQMRQLDHSGLTSLYRNSRRACTKATTFFRDAIPMLQTKASVSLVKDLMQSRDTSAMDADIWLTSLAFIPRPSLDLLSEAASLLEISGPRARKAMLAVSSLVNTYCTVIDAACMDSTEVTTIMNTFETKLNYNCNGDHDVVLMALKAVGNAGHNDKIVATLERCFANDQLAMEVRVGAITAYRRLPCSANRDALMTLYNNLDQDSELRINAYLQMVRCATDDTMEKIRESLGREEVNQVGSFVWTHLTNLQETSDPLKESIADILGDEELKKVFDLDARKFSRNIEWSAFSHLLNTGATLESNIIMSHQSFIPRTASLNFTLDIFGEAINFFEVEGRMEGFEKIMEDLFGPKQEFNDLVGRNKRSVDNYLDAFDNTYKPRPESEPHAAYSMKVFGNEVRYGDFHSITVDSMKDKLNYIDWFISLAQEREMEVTKSLLFMEATMVVPTATGLPLNLDAEGAATINVKAAGKLDLLRLASKPAHIDIDGTLEPSGAVEIRSSMGVNAKFAKTGLEMVSTMHSSTVVKGNIQLQDGSVFSMDLDMPNDKQEILNVESKFLVSHRDEQRVQRMLTDNVFSLDECAELKALGLELCAQASVPLATGPTSAMLPFTGPVTASLSLNKKDTHTGYHLEAKYVQEMSGSVVASDLVMFSVNTPGSSVDREITTKFFLDRANWALNLNLKSPWTNVNFDGSVMYTPSQWGLKSETTVDGHPYILHLDMPITQQKNGREYTPSILFSIPQLLPVKVNGRLFVNPGRKIEYELRTKNIFTEPAKVDGSVVMINNRNKMRYDVTCDVESQYFTTSVEANVDYTRGQSLSSRVHLEYEMGDTKDSFTINNKLKLQNTNTLTQYHLTSSWTNTVWPSYNGDLNLDITYGRNTLAANLDAGFDKNSRVKVTQSGNYDFSSDKKKIDGFVKLELPRGSEYELTAKHSHSNDELASVLSLKYGPSSEGTLEVNLKRESNDPFKLSADMKLTYPDREIKLVEVIEQKSATEYHHKFEAIVQGDTVVDMQSVFKTSPRLELTTDLNVPKLQPVKIILFFKPNVKDLQGHAEFNYGQNKYYVDGEWNHGGNVMAFASRGKMDLLYPGRRIKAAADLSRRGAVISGNFATQWDADNDSSKEFKMNGRTTMSADNPGFYIKGEMYPRKFIEFNANAKYETASWMRSSSDLEGNLILKSSFPSFEDVGFSFKYDHSPSAVVIHTEGGAGTNKIIGDLNMNTNTDYTESGLTMKVTTPFETLHDIDLTANYAVAGRSLEGGMKFEWDGNPLELTVTGTGNIRRHAISGEMKFTSYLTRPVTFTLSHSDNQQIFDTNMVAKWGRNQQMNYDQKLTYNAWSKLAADIKFTSPFENFEEITLVSTTEKSGNTYTTDHELKWAQDQMIKLISSLTYDGPIITGNLRLTTPMQEFDRLVINIDNRKQGELFVGHADLECTGIEKVELDTQVGIGNIKKVAFTFKSEPELGVTTFNAEFNGHSRKFTAALEFMNTKLQREKVSLTSDVDISNLRNIIASVKYTSPFQPLTFFNLDILHQKQGRTYTTEGTLEYPEYRGTIKNTAEVSNWLNFKSTTEIEYQPGKRIEQTTSMSTNPKIEAKFEMKAPFSDPISFSLDHTGQATNFDTNVGLTYGGGKTLSGAASFAMDNLPAITGEFTVNTPFRGWRKMFLKFDHKKPRRTSMSNIEVSWNPRNKITGNLQLTAQRQKYSGSLTVTTPFSKLSKFNAEYDVAGPITDFTSTASLEINDFRYTSDSSFELNINDKTMEGTTTVTTPHDGFESIVAKINHNGPANDFTTNAELTIGSDKGTISLKSSVVDNIEVEIEINNPFDLTWFTLETFKGGVVHNAKNWRNFNAEGYVEINGQRFGTDITFKWFGTTLQLDTNVQNPSQDYGLKIKHKGRLSDFSTTVTLDTGEDNVKAEAEFKNERNGKRGNFELVTPYRGYERTALDFNHEGQIDDFTTTLKIETPNSEVPTIDIRFTHKGALTAFENSLKAEWDGKTLETAVTFSTEPQNTAGTVSLKTPFDGYDNFEFAVKYEIARNNFLVGASLVTPFASAEKTSVEIKYEGDLQRGFTSSVEVITSIQNYDNWKAEFEYKPIRSGISATATVNTPIQDYSMFKASLTHAGQTPSRIQTTMALESSVPGYDKFSAELKHTLSNGDLESSFTVDTPIEEFASQSISATYKGDPSDFAAKVGLTTSYPGYAEWGVEVTHTLEDNMNMNSKVVATTPLSGYESFSSEVDFSNSGSGFTARADVMSSIQGFDRFSAQIECTLTEIGLTTKFVVETPIRNWNKFTADFVYASRSATSFKTKLSLDTPIRAFNHFSVDINHEGDASAFETSVDIAIPLRRFPKFGFSISHNGVLKDFTTVVGFTYGQNKKIDTSLQFKTDGNLYEGSIKMTCPCPVVQNFELMATHDRSGSGNLDITYNADKVVDMDYAYSKTVPFTLKINVNHPRPYNIEVNFDMQGINYKGDVMVNLEGQRFRLDVDLSNSVENYNLERKFEIAVALPNGKYRRFSTHYTATASRITEETEIQWAKDDTSKATLNLDLSINSRRNEQTVSGNLQIASPWLNSRSTINHSVRAGRQFTTEVVMTTDQTITMKNELTLDRPSFKNVFTMSHPNLRDPILCEIETDVGVTKLEGNLKLQMARESFTMHAKAAHEGRKGVVELQMTHPNNYLDLDFMGEIEDSPQVLGVNSHFKWKTSSDRQIQEYKYLEQYKKSDGEYILQLSCPSHSTELVGKKSISDIQRGIHRWSLSGSFDQQELNAEFGWSKPDKTMDALLQLGDDKIHAVQTVNNVRDRNLEVYHEIGGRKTQDMYFSMTTDNNGVFNGRSYIRPNIIQDLTEYVKGIHIVSGENCLKDLMTSMGEDLQQKWNVARQRTLPALNNAIDNIAGAQIDIIKRTYTRMYANNDFQLRRIVNSAFRKYGTFKTAMSNLAEKSLESYSVIQRKVSAKLSYWGDKVNHQANELGQRIVELRNEYGPVMQDFNEIIDTITNKVKAIVASVRNHPVVRRAKATLRRLKSMDLFEPIQNLQTQVEATLGEFKEKYGQYFAVFEDVWRNVARRQEVRKMKGLLGKTRNSVIWFMKTYKVKERLQQAVEDLNQVSLDAMQTQVMDEVRSRFQFDKNQVKSWDPKSGNYEVQFYLPDDPFEDLHLPKLYLKENLMKMMSWINENLEDLEVTAYDLLYAYEPSSDWSEWVPPFGTHAAISGSQHFMTFDKKFFEFAGECTYLLARDFVDHHFSIAVKFENGAKKTVYVRNDDDTVEITDGKLMMNGNMLELPWKGQHSSIRRMGSDVQIDCHHGVTVMCSLHYDFCTVNFTGWYFGKMGGLLGTYDNEPYTDFTSSRNERMTSVEDFANTWAIGSQCSGSNVARQVSSGAGDAAYDLCAKYFQDTRSSPFRSCFSQVDPKPFMQMCINDMGKDGRIKEQDMCKAGALYVKDCNTHKYPVRIPHTCVSCADQNGNDFPEDDDLRLEGGDVPQSADIILVIEQAECNQEVVPTLTEVVGDLNQALESEGLTNNRFGIVGYGAEGKFNQPHDHTLGGEIMNTVQNIASGLDNLDIEGRTPGGDALMALQYAIKYPFRAGVAKTVLLIPCDACYEGKTRYHEIQQLFRDRDIGLHVLMDHTFSLKNRKTKETPYLFGADKQGLFTRKHIKGSLESDKELYNQVRLPKDICVELAFERDGTVFNKNFLLDSRRQNQKRFVEVMVRVIADHSKPTECQICECVGGGDGVGRSVCRGCVQEQNFYGLYPSIFGGAVPGTNNGKETFQVDFEEYLNSGNRH